MGVSLERWMKKANPATASITTEEPQYKADRLIAQRRIEKERRMQDNSVKRAQIG
jgi:hypothetical protein